MTCYNNQRVDDDANYNRPTILFKKRNSNLVPTLTQKLIVHSNSKIHTLTIGKNLKKLDLKRILFGLHSYFQT
jgi:hypothetical protein